jgi:adenylate cyclase class IV
MHTEFEVKFLGIDLQELEQKVIGLWGVMVMPMTVMKRAIFDLQGKWEYVRVRDEGKVITMTYKQMISTAIDGTKEINIIVDNYDHAVEILECSWLTKNTIQESKRMMYELDSCEICFDYRPGISPYCEIEWPTQEDVEFVSQKLWLDLSTAFGGTVNLIYQQELWFIPGELETIKELSFANPPMKK